MTTVADPGPTDKSVLYDQDSHVSSAVWDGQVGLKLYLYLFFNSIQIRKVVRFYLWLYTQ